jgi:ketopantoate reductase
MLFGGCLSRRHDVVLIDKDPSRVQSIQDGGILIRELDGSVFAATPRACLLAASRRNHVPAPRHEFMVHMIHAMEDGTRQERADAQDCN